MRQFNSTNRIRSRQKNSVKINNTNETRISVVRNSKKGQFKENTLLQDLNFITNERAKREKFFSACMKKF